MREIKFRLIKDGKVVGYEKHCDFGDGAGFQIFHAKPGSKTCKAWHNILLGGRYIPHNSKDQFTSHKDKNVCANDIITAKFLNEQIRGAVVFDERHLQWMIFTKGAAITLTKAVTGTMYPLCELAEIEKIGNIHSDPELLTAT